MIGLAKDFALSRIEKKLAAKAKEAELKSLREGEFRRKAQQKAIDETDPWQQYREQSEKMEHIRIQTQRMKQSAVHDARNQTAVLDTSSHDDGLGASDQTFWAKHLTKSHFGNSKLADNIAPGGMSFPTRAESLDRSKTLMSRDPRIIYIEDSNGNPINISDLAQQVRSANKPLVILADKFGKVRGYYHNLKDKYPTIETAEDLVNKTMLGLMLYSNPLVGSIMIGAAYAFPEHVQAIKTNISNAFGRAVKTLEPDLSPKQIDHLASLGNTVVELSAAKYIISSAAAKSSSLIGKFKPESKIFTAPNGLTAEIIKLENASYVWNELGYVETGEYIEKILDQNLNQYFKTFDYFDKGVAKSIKTFQTNAKSYNGKPTIVRSRLKGYVDKVNDFTEYRVKADYIHFSDIKERVLEIAVPHLDNPMHQQVFKEIVEYGMQQKNKVKVQIKIIKE